MSFARRIILLISGPALFTIVYLLMPDSVLLTDGSTLDLGIGGKVTAGMTAWMALWWVTEATPLYVTALLPLIVLPLSGQQAIAETATSYGNRIVYFALGGFILAAVHNLQREVPPANIVAMFRAARELGVYG